MERGESCQDYGGLVFINTRGLLEIRVLRAISETKTVDYQWERLINSSYVRYVNVQLLEAEKRIAVLEGLLH